MAEVVTVTVAASPRLLHDALASCVDGNGVEVIESGDPQVAIVTPDRAAEAASEVVIVVEDGPRGDLLVMTDGGQPRRTRVTADALRTFVLDLAAQHAGHPSAPPGAAPGGLVPRPSDPLGIEGADVGDVIRP